RAWFGEKYRWLIEQGIDGFWNDMNEPAIFYSEKNLNAVIDKITALKGKNLDIYGYFGMKNMVNALGNNENDYKSFYHNMDGVKVRHDKVHNIYGYNMTRAASEAFDRIDPEHRILMFSRSSYIGMHRYGGIWTGDNCSWWSHILQSIQQMPALNMCGLLYVGSDIGGFSCNTTQDLLMRWLEFGLFTPLMRNHTALSMKAQEVYRFDAIDDFRNIIRIRYALIPYIYSEFMKAALDDEMYFRSLAFDYPEDVHTYGVEDQLMVGDSIMIAPVYRQNAKGRYVYLPEDMLMVRMKSPEDKEMIPMEKGHHYVDIALNELVIFVKKNYMLPMAVLDKNLKSTCDLKEDSYEWIGYVDDKAQYVLYTDDGISKNCMPKEMWKVYRFTAEDFREQYSMVKEA
ncbi:MAG: glycoside hydrolase family 31 protein, partial [Dorea sp.]